MTTASRLVFYVNGVRQELSDSEPDWTLSYYLRQKLRLTGTKLGCQEGQCGSCTVMWSRVCPKTGKVLHEAINACLVPLFAVHGKHIITVEGVGSVEKGLHPVQERILRGHGSQCGYCTPGFVMSMYALLRNNPEPSPREIETALHGNLCRCTGYRPILESLYTFSKGGCGIANCCKNKKPGAQEMLTAWDEVIKPYDATQEPIFPPELQTKSDEFLNESLVLKGAKYTLYRPATMEELLALKKEHGDNSLIVGYTVMAAALEKFSPKPHNILISTAGVKELTDFTIGENGAKFGAGLTLTQLGHFFNVVLKKYGEEKSAFIDTANWNVQNLFTPQLRNQSTWAGNLAQGQGQPTSDLTCVFLAAKGQVEVVNDAGVARMIEVTQDFFPSGNRVNIEKNEVITAGFLPASDKYDFFMAYKQGLRHGDGERGIVNAAFWIKFNEDGTVADARFAYGGVKSTPILVQSAEEIKGKKLGHETVHAVVDKLTEEVKEFDEFGSVCCVSLFARFYNDARKRWCELFPDQVASNPYPHDDDPSFRSKAKSTNDNFNHMTPLQLFSNNSEDSCGRPLVHQYGDKHTTGEAQYVGDLKFDNMLYAAVVQSQKAHAKIKNVDTSEALKVPGVVGWADANDIPSGGNNVSHEHSGFPDDSQFFATDIAVSQGQIIGVVLADDLNVAHAAALKVKVEYEELPSIGTLEEGIKKENFMGPASKASRGDVEASLKASQFTLKGELGSGGQEHIYMEPQCAIAVPEESDEMTIYSSTQCPAAVQTGITKLLNVPANKVVIKTKRLGGAFGGKQDDCRHVTGPAAVAAKKFNRPVSLQLTRHEDLIATGKRHELKGTFEVGFDKEGRITALRFESYVNAGSQIGSSIFLTFVIPNAFDSTYKIPAGDVSTRAVRTNRQSNTAFRGFGQPQAFFIADLILQNIAHYLNKPPEQVRENNFSEDGWRMIGFGSVLNDNLRRVWDECMQLSNFKEKVVEFKEFNKKFKWRKRGLAILPTRYLLGHGGAFEQGQALVHIYLDGTVLISIGGVEMGQGLNVKCLQIAQRALGIPIESITIKDCDTTRTPNAPPTGGSQGSDVYGLGVKNACDELIKTLEPYKKSNESGGWKAWVGAAYADRRPLSAVGLGVPPREGLTGLAARYSVSGACATEVEVDCLTGDYEILSAIMVMDLGDSLNPAIDIGQIEGGFVQGYGMFTMEELTYVPDGRLSSRSMFTYKIPTVDTVPRKFVCSLLKDSDSPGNIYSSKGVGEPPFYLGASVYFALLDAINSKRADHGSEPITIIPPLTVRKIRLACADPLLGKVQAKKNTSQ